MELSFIILTVLITSGENIIPYEIARPTWFSAPQNNVGFAISNINFERYDDDRFSFNLTLTEKNQTSFSFLYSQDTKSVFRLRANMIITSGQPLRLMSASYSANFPNGKGYGAVPVSSDLLSPFKFSKYLKVGLMITGINALKSIQKFPFNFSVKPAQRVSYNSKFEDYVTTVSDDGTLNYSNPASEPFFQNWSGTYLNFSMESSYSEITYSFTVVVHTIQNTQFYLTGYDHILSTQKGPNKFVYLTLPYRSFSGYVRRFYGFNFYASNLSSVNMNFSYSYQKRQAVFNGNLENIMYGGTYFSYLPSGCEKQIKRVDIQFKSSQPYYTGGITFSGNSSLAITYPTQKGKLYIVYIRWTISNKQPPNTSIYLDDIPVLKDSYTSTNSFRFLSQDNLDKVVRIEVRQQSLQKNHLSGVSFNRVQSSIPADNSCPTTCPPYLYPKKALGFDFCISCQDLTGYPSTYNQTSGRCSCPSETYDQQSIQVCVDCSKINNTDNITYVANKTCICVGIYIWNNTALTCVINCSKVINTTKKRAIQNKCECIPFNSWNETSKQCEFSDPCLPPYFYDSKQPTCLLNCSNVTNAVKYTSKTGNCRCEPSFTWVLTELRCLCITPSVLLSNGICAPNCSNISNTDNSTSVDNSCVCVGIYEWDGASLSCRMSCSKIGNTTNQTAIGGKCDCIAFNKWNAQAKRCQFEDTCRSPLYYDMKLPFCAINCSKVDFTADTPAQVGSCVCLPNFVWNAANLSCDCSSPNSLSPSGSCLPNCSEVANANGQYPFNRSCVCLSPFEWEPTNETCVLNCSLVGNATGPSAPNSCRCLISFYWDAPTSTCRFISICPKPYFFNNTAGFCELNCSLFAGTDGPAIVNGKCVCLLGFKWQWESFMCLCPQPFIVDSTTKSCIPNCASFNNTDNKTAVNGSCNCIAPFKWDANMSVCEPFCPLPSFFNASTAKCSVNCLRVALSNGSNSDGTCKCRAPYIWNALLMACRTPNCGQSMYFNVSTASCRLNCSALNNTHGTHFNGSCICKLGYSWNSVLQLCQDWCLSMQFTNGKPSIGNGVCVCINSSFYFDSSSKVCRIQCMTIANIDWTVIRQPIGWCVCMSKFAWNSSTYKCDLNCSAVANSDKKPAVDGKCACVSPFRWSSRNTQCQ